MKYDPKEFYRAHLARDYRFDGKFFVAVKTTKIYCRPICPARKAKLENLEFYINAIEAEAAGYRPCLRCRPETAPGSSAWIGTSAIVRRALRIMESSALTELSIKELAFRLGISVRWLGELFVQQLGANPQTVLISKKLNIAKNLLESSPFSITDVAFSSGFQSIRRFNDAFKNKFQKTPSQFKQEPFSNGVFKIYLNYRPPYAWDKLLNFFDARALLAMELVKDESYQRLISHDGVCGWVKAQLNEGNKVEIEFKLNKSANIVEFVTRIKNMFDLDADPMAIDATLGEDKQLKPYLKYYSGLRIPGCWDGFELAVRTIIGQKISVKGARTILNRLVTTYGKKQSFDETLPMTHFFPTAADIITADLSKIGLTTAKVASIKALAHEVANKNLILDGTEDFVKTCEKLLAIKGIGSWSVEYIAMRALRNPDAFPNTDLELQKKIKHLGLNPAKWAPWRGYAAILLWNLKL